MKIETKFNIGDKVKFTKNGGLLEAEVIAVETLNKSDVSFITYVVMTKDGRFFRFNPHSCTRSDSFTLKH